MIRQLRMRGLLGGELTAFMTELITRLAFFETAPLLLVLASGDTSQQHPHFVAAGISHAGAVEFSIRKMTSVIKL